MKQEMQGLGPSQAKMFFQNINSNIHSGVKQYYSDAIEILFYACNAPKGIINIQEKNVYLTKNWTQCL